MMTMSLTLHSQIGLNLMLTKDALIDAVVTLNGKTYTLADLTDTNGIYKITAAIAPNVANEAITLVIEFNGKTHTIPISIATYAETILGSTTYSKAHNLTYAMVEYVRAMTGDTEFCKDAKVPADYKPVSIPALTPATEVADGETTESGYFISFKLDSTIAIAVTGGTTETVTLKIANRTLTKDMVGGTVVFEPLAVNELANVFSVTIDGTTYEYSLVDYYYAMPTPPNAKVVEALYNYAYHAKVYVAALQDAANGNAENA